MQKHTAELTVRVPICILPLLLCTAVPVLII